MAAGNPSTIGTGTEVLRRSFWHANSNADRILITGVANHIYSVLSLIICNMGGSGDDELFSLYVDPDTGTDNIYMTSEERIPPQTTYIFSEKISVTNTDVLWIWTSAGNMDIYCTFIDQDWS